MTQLELEPPATVPLPSTCILYHGDCLEVMPTLEADSVACVIADLPYGVTRNTWDQRIDPAAFWVACSNVTAFDAKIILSATQPFASLMVCSNQKNFKYDIIWDKCMVTGHLNAKSRPLRKHEHLLIFSSSRGTYNPQKVCGTPFRKNINVPTKNYNVFGAARAINTTGDRYPTSVLKVTAERKPGNHPTQKPVALLEWLVLTYTNPGDTVLDPCMGSGVAGVACARLGRSFIGIEKDPSYFATAKKRIEDERRKLGLQ